MPEERPRRIAVGAVLHVYWQHVRKHPYYIAVVLTATILTQVANLVSPLYLRQFFNLLVTERSSAAAIATLTATLSLIFLWWFINWAMTRLQDFANTYLESQIMTELYDTAFGYLIDHSYSFFISNFAGTLIHRVSRFARSFEILFDGIIVQFFPAFLFVGGAVFVLYLHNHILGLALGVWALCFIAFQAYITRRRQPIRAARAEAEARVTGTLSDAVGNHSTILLFSGASHELRQFSSVVEKWHAATIRAWFTDGLFFAALGLFILFIQVGLLWGAIIFWSRGELTIGDFVLIQTYLLSTFGQLMSINFQLRRFYDALADASEMVEILQTPHEVYDAPEAQPLQIHNGTISFEDVSFSFSPTRPILSHFNLTITGGQKAALVGPSGAGKSTITRLLLRLFDVRGGQVCIDGQNIASITQVSLRDAIAFVPQEPILFHRSLIENIRYGRRDATDAEVVEAAKKAHCHEFISELPEGYSTYVGERGVKLSGGERQRVAIARAILKDAPILVLDEATSSLDSESEALIQDALSTLMQGKTVLVIAHRLSTIMKMDRIIVLDGGAIVADGTHSNLLAQGGLYQKLWNIQAGGFLTDEGGPTTAVEETQVEEDEDILEELAGEEGEK